MMINLKQIHSPITLETLEVFAPDAFSELVMMDAEARTLLLHFLNGRSSSPKGRGYADIELDKEDAIHSKLKTEYFIEVTSEKVKGNFVRHLMTQSQRHDFFNDRDKQRRRVRDAVYKQRRKDRDKAYRQDIKERGEGWAFARVRFLADKMRSSNDEVIK